MKRPTAEDSFMWRICIALGQEPHELAKNLGVDYIEIGNMLPLDRGKLVEVDRDEVWMKLNKYIGDRMGLLMAIKIEINRSLQRSRIDRLKRMETFERTRQ